MKNVTRNGKIARLPLVVREELNRRLADGEEGKALVAWLNGLPEVEAIVVAEFWGKPVRQQNLSEWKKGGYQDWVDRQQLLELAPRLGEEAAELAAQNDRPVSDVLALWVTARYAMAARRLPDCQGVEGWKLLRELGADVAELRRGDHRAAQLALDRERLALEARRGEAGGRPPQPQPPDELPAAGPVTPLHSAPGESDSIRPNPTDEGGSQGNCSAGASPALGNRSGRPTMTTPTAALDPRSQGRAERVGAAASDESDPIRLNPGGERCESQGLDGLAAKLDMAGDGGPAARHAMKLPRQGHYQSPTLVTRAARTAAGTGPSAQRESESIRLNPGDEECESEWLDRLAAGLGEPIGRSGLGAHPATKLPLQGRYQTPTLVTRKWEWREVLRGPDRGGSFWRANTRQKERGFL